jgi:predicted phage gp36 major capsid-like protein
VTVAQSKVDRTQYRVRCSFGDGVLVQAAFFVWANTEGQAVRRVKKVAPRADVVEVAAIGRLVPADEAPRPSRAAGAGTGPAVPRFFDDGRRGSHVD